MFGLLFFTHDKWGETKETDTPIQQGKGPRQSIMSDLSVNTQFDRKCSTWRIEGYFSPLTDIHAWGSINKECNKYIHPTTL